MSYHPDDHPIQCPDDLPQPFDFDNQGRDADAALEYARRAYAHRVVTQAQLTAAIAGPVEPAFSVGFLRTRQAG